MTSKFRDRLSDKLLDLGNYCLTGLVLGQAFVKQLHLSTLFFVGLGGLIIAYTMAYLLSD